jgi:MFS family permease
MNLFTNVATLVFYYFTRWANKHFQANADPATGEKLTEKNKKWEVKKVLELPWVFWVIMAFSLFQTSTSIVFTQNATELAEQRFNTDSITAGWYTAVLQYAGFFVVPLLGIFIDLFGQRISLLAICGTGVFMSMALLNWAPTTKGTAASFGIYALAFSLGPTTIIDSIRTSMWHQSVFGSAYAIKLTMNNSINIVVRVITGVIQDADNNSYHRVTIVYVVLAGGSVLVSIMLLILSYLSIDLRRLQWTRKQRMSNGELINERKENFEGKDGERNRRLSKICLSALGCLVLGGWVAYFWGVATGNNG